MSNIDDLMRENPSFFSEEHVNSWMKKRYEQLDKIKIALIRAIVPVMISGVVFGVSLAWLLTIDPVTFAGIVIIVNIGFFLLWFFMVRDKFVYFMTVLLEKRDGKWFGTFQCGCESWIKSIERKEIEKYKETELVEECATCKKPVKMVKIWRYTLSQEDDFPVPAL